MARQKTGVPAFYACPDCRSKQVIRRVGNRRPRGHKKWLWCVRCKKETNHVLVSS